jgi:hypothetical protein
VAIRPIIWAVLRFILSRHANTRNRHEPKAALWVKTDSRLATRAGRCSAVVDKTVRGSVACRARGGGVATVAGSAAAFCACRKGCAAQKGVYPARVAPRVRCPVRCAEQGHREGIEVTKSPSSGRSKPRASPELIPCRRCGVLFSAKHAKLFCSHHCRGRQAAEARLLRDSAAADRRLNVPPPPADELAIVIDDRGN